MTVITHYESSKNFNDIDKQLAETDWQKNEIVLLILKITAVILLTITLFSIFFIGMFQAFDQSIIALPIISGIITVISGCFGIKISQSSIMDFVLATEILDDLANLNVDEAVARFDTARLARYRYIDQSVKLEMDTIFKRHAQLCTTKSVSLLHQAKEISNLTQWWVGVQNKHFRK